MCKKIPIIQDMSHSSLSAISAMLQPWTKPIIHGYWFNAVSIVIGSSAQMTCSPDTSCIHVSHDLYISQQDNRQLVIYLVQLFIILANAWHIHAWREDYVLSFSAWQAFASVSAFTMKFRVHLMRDNRVVMEHRFTGSMSIIVLLLIGVQTREWNWSLSCPVALQI
jgi:hypothetical protein